MPRAGCGEKRQLTASWCVYVARGWTFNEVLVADGPVAQAAAQPPEVAALLQHVLASNQAIVASIKPSRLAPSPSRSPKGSCARRACSGPTSPAAAAALGRSRWRLCEPRWLGCWPLLPDCSPGLTEQSSIFRGMRRRLGDRTCLLYTSDAADE